MSPFAPGGYLLVEPDEGNRRHGLAAGIHDGQIPAGICDHRVAAHQPGVFGRERHAGNPHEAQDITQAVFVTLARKAAPLRAGTVLSGWLFHAARLTACNVLRANARRVRREQEAYMRARLDDSNGGDDWNRIAPLLDMAMADLGEKDRNAIVLRYMEGKDLREVGKGIGASEEAAKKRVGRAVEKLRGFFTKRGIVLSSGALAGAITANAVQAAPAGLAAVVTAGAMTEGAAAAAATFTLAKGAMKLMTWTKVKIALGAGLAALAAYEWHQNDVQTKQVAALQQELRQTKQDMEKQQAAIETLKREKLAMVDEKLAQEKAAARIMAHQRASLTAAAAKNYAASGKSNSLSSALGKMFDDPSMKQFMREQQLTQVKSQYAPLIKSLNLNQETADKLMQLLGDDAVRKMDIGMQLMKGDVDSATVAQQQIAAKNELDTQVQSLLTGDGYAQFQQFQEELPARTMVTLFKANLSDNALTDEQSTQLLQLMKAAPSSDAASQFNSPASATEDYFQKMQDNNQQVLQKAAGFLNPDQLAALATFQTNMLGMMKAGASIQKELFGGK